MKGNRVAVRTPSGIKLHAIRTGYVAVKPSHRKLSVFAPLRLPTILLDPRFTEWLPIYAWIIEHSEGTIVVDTGDSSQSADPDYYNCDPGSRFIYNRILKTSVRPEDELGAQLGQLGIDPESVRWVVQTHMHSDHMGGLSTFRNAEFIISRHDFAVSNATLTCRIPDWLEPAHPTFRNGPFEQGFTLTDKGDVSVIPTPGHTRGHQSVILKDAVLTYFFAGDTSFDEAQLKKDVVAGICEDVPEARNTLERIRTFVREHPTVYLPSHDPQSGARLAQNLVTTA